MVMLDKDLAIICQSVLTGRITYGNTIKWALRHTIFVLPKLSAHEGAYSRWLILTLVLQAAPR